MAHRRCDHAGRQRRSFPEQAAGRASIHGHPRRRAAVAPLGSLSRARSSGCARRRVRRPFGGVSPPRRKSSKDPAIMERQSMKHHHLQIGEAASPGDSPQPYVHVVFDDAIGSAFNCDCAARDGAAGLGERGTSTWGAGCVRTRRSSRPGWARGGRHGHITRSTLASGDRSGAVEDEKSGRGLIADHRTRAYSPGDVMPSPRRRVG